MEFSLTWWYVLLVVLGVCRWASSDTILEMDKYSVCGKEFFINDNDVTLMWPSKVAPSNPPLECIVFLTSGYSETSGGYKLQIVVEALDIRDCSVHLDFFNGRGTYGSFIRAIGCGSKSTDVMYSTGNQITVRLARNQALYETGNMFVFKIRSYKSPDEGIVMLGTLKLTIGAIIGIVIGIIALIVIAILLGWCYKTGKLNYYAGRTIVEEEEKHADDATVNNGVNNAVFTEKSSSFGSGLQYQNEALWNTVTGSQSNNRKLGRNFWQSDTSNGFAKTNYRNENARYENEKTATEKQRLQSETENHDYEKYENKNQVVYENKAVRLDVNQTGSAAATWSKEEGETKQTGLNRNDANRSSRQKQSLAQSGDTQENVSSFKRDEGVRGSRGSRRSTGSGEYKTGGKEEEDEKEGEIKRPPSGLFENPDEEGYLYDYDHVKSLSDENIDPAKRGEPHSYDAFVRDAPGGTRLRSSDRDSLRGSKREKLLPSSSSSPTNKKRSGVTADVQTPELGTQDLESQQMKRYLSIDLKSEPESDQMSNPNVVNAAVRANVPDKAESPAAKKRKKKGGKHGRQASGGTERDLPPEASEPVFTTPVSSDPYQPASVPYGPYGTPGYGNNMYPANQQFMPFGMIPMAAFGPNQGQTIAFAYQTLAPPGQAQGQAQQVAGQAAWVVQSTPGDEGPVNKTTFMMKMQEQTTPSESSSRVRDPSHPGTPAFTSTPGTDLTPRRTSKFVNQRPADPADISVIAAGAVPPDPGPGHRSAVMKSGIDPKTGMQTTQVTWTDNIVDPSDPPGPNPQITRKTITRVTARSGQGDLPEASSTILNQLSAPESDEPAFLSPSAIRQEHRAPRPMTEQQTHDIDNIGFYLGQHNPVVHDAPGQHRAFRNQIRMDETET